MIEQCHVDISSLPTTKENPYVIDRGMGSVNKYAIDRFSLPRDEVEQHYFHGAAVNDILNICEKGLLTKPGYHRWFISEDKVYVTNSPLGALGWVMPVMWATDDYDPGLEYPLLIFRIPKNACRRWDCDMKGSESQDFPQMAFSCDHDIAPEHLEYLTKDGWVKLRDGGVG